MRVEVRTKLMNEDLKTAVFNPALSVIAPTTVAKGQTLDTIIPDARIKYLSGAIDRGRAEGQIKRWYDSGGTQIAAGDQRPGRQGSAADLAQGARDTRPWPLL